MSFEIKTNAYEGPLDLLISLIEKREIFISDISLVQVTDDYISYIESLDEKDIAHMSEFVLTASTLLLIKSKSLLPTLDLSPEEEDSIEDLEARISLYREIKKHVEGLLFHLKKGSLYERGEIKERGGVFAPGKDMTTESLLSSLEECVKMIPEKEKELPKIEVQKTISLKDTIEKLRQRIERNIHTSFLEFSGGDRKERVAMVLHFLALLELIKQGMVDAYQEKNFDDIMIESETLSTPKYGL